MHGEQGSDWGDDEEQFEWLDTQNAPEAVNGTGKHAVGGGLSPSKRLSRIKAAVKPTGHATGHEGRRLRKQLTFARRAPPPPLDKEPAPPPVFTETGEATTPPATARPLPPTLQRGLSRSKRFHGNPLQPTTSQPTAERRPMAEGAQSSPATAPADSLHHPVPVRKPPPLPVTAAPTLVPLKDESASAPMPKNQSRNSQMSFQSVAYSLYDLDGDSTSPVPSPGPGSDLVFPKGRYTRVKASALDIDGDRRTRKGSERSLGSGHTIGKNDTYRTPEEFVSAGIESRGRGDLAKSAWYFMKATEGGSLTGKMYYGKSPRSCGCGALLIDRSGLALRHGWGIAKDERRAFTLLRQACDDSLAAQKTPSMDIQQSPGVIKLSLAQKKEMAVSDSHIYL